MAPPLQKCMDDLVEVFNSYSKKRGDKYTLGKAELVLLINKELSDYIAVSKDPASVNKLMSDMDKDKDGEVDFEEFVKIVARCTVLCHNFFVGRQQLFQ